MAPHSSILACKTGVNRGAWPAIVHGATESDMTEHNNNKFCFNIYWIMQIVSSVVLGTYFWSFLQHLPSFLTILSDSQSEILWFLPSLTLQSNEGERCYMNKHISVQFSSVAQSCPTLCHPMNRSTPGLPVHHQLPEFTRTHIHQVSDAIQPSHPLSSPSPPDPNPSLEKP